MISQGQKTISSSHFHEFFESHIRRIFDALNKCAPVRPHSAAAAAAVSTKRLKKTERKAPLLALALPLAITFVA